MKTEKKTELEESKSLDLEKDDKQFPKSQFKKDQRKDADKAQAKDEHSSSDDDQKGSKIAENS